jgi:hypothetical protein
VLVRTALIAPIVAATLFMTAPCVSADASAPSTAPGVGLANANAVIVPPAWAGVWDVYDAFDPTCRVYPTVSYRDTLCAGDVILVGDRTGIVRNTLFSPVYPAPPVTCPGPVFTDTQLTFGCTYNGSGCYDFHGSPPKYSSYTYQLQWDLSGDVATTSTSYTYVAVVITAGGTCIFLPATCIRSTGTRTRVWPESSICGAVPTRPASWGKLKLLYR